MICPLKEELYDDTKKCVCGGECGREACAWWNPKENFNPETKQYEGECCIKTLSNLQISGGINTHAY